MMNLDNVVMNFMQQETQLGERMRAAVSYTNAVKAGEISESEYQELMEDLRRLDNVQVLGNELDQKIAFDNCMRALMSIPI